MLDALNPLTQYHDGARTKVITTIVIMITVVMTSFIMTLGIMTSFIIIPVGNRN